MNSPMIYSNVIAKAVQYALSDGNEIVEISDGWTKVRQVVHMNRPLSGMTRDQISQLKLRHWTVEPTPHNKAEEGFSDDVEKVAITFPR